MMNMSKNNIREVPLLGAKEKINYEAFLSSSYWRFVSSKIKERDGNACRICGNHNGLNVHHIKYVKRGTEHLKTDCLVTLCFNCHRMQHIEQYLIKTVNELKFDIEEFGSAQVMPPSICCDSRGDFDHSSVFLSIFKLKRMGHISNDLDISYQDPFLLFYLAISYGEDSDPDDEYGWGDDSKKYIHVDSHFLESPD